jgi:hypothetical protein
MYQVGRPGMMQQPIPYKTSDPHFLYIYTYEEENYLLGKSDRRFCGFVFSSSYRHSLLRSRKRLLLAPEASTSHEVQINDRWLAPAHFARPLQHPDAKLCLCAPQAILAWCHGQLVSLSEATGFCVFTGASWFDDQAGADPRSAKPFA